MRPLELAGSTFGDLTALDRERSARGGSAWRCSCKCGAEEVIQTSDLTTGRRRRCAACARRKAVQAVMATRFPPLPTGLQVGRLTVLSLAGFVGKDGSRLYQCKCECGTVSVRVGHMLLAGTQQSCGCLQRESRRKPRPQKQKSSAAKKETQSRLRRKHVAELSDFYITQQLSKGLGIGHTKVPRHLIPLKREQMAMKRLAKEFRKAISTKDENHETITEHP